MLGLREYALAFRKAGLDFDIPAVRCADDDGTRFFDRRAGFADPDFVSPNGREGNEQHVPAVAGVIVDIGPISGRQPLIDGGEIDGDVEYLILALGLGDDGRSLANAFVGKIGYGLGCDADFGSGRKVPELVFGAFGGETQFPGAVYGQKHLVGLDFFTRGELVGFDRFPGLLPEAAIDDDPVDARRDGKEFAIALELIEIFAG